MQKMSSGVFVVGGRRSKLSGREETERAVPENYEELKARLMREAEEAIDQMLGEAEDKGRLTITDIEKLARKTGEQVMGEVTQALVDEESNQPESNVCPHCGKKMQHKGLKGRDLITETGEVRLERGYYYCKSCRTGLFPPGSPDEAGEERVQSGISPANGMGWEPAAL